MRRVGRPRSGRPPTTHARRPARPGTTVISTAQIAEESLRDSTSLDDLADGGGFNFKTDAQRFFKAITAGGASVSIAQTRRPHVKAMVMHVISCVALGCDGGSLSIPCQPEFCAGDWQALVWRDIDAAALRAVEAAGASTVPELTRWTAEEVQEVQDYMQEHTFACEPWLLRVDSLGRTCTCRALRALPGGFPAGSLCGDGVASSMRLAADQGPLTAHPITNQPQDFKCSAQRPPCSPAPPPWC